VAVWDVRGSIDDVVETSTDRRQAAAAPVMALAPAVVAGQVAGQLGGQAGDGGATMPAWVDYVSALGPVIVLVGALVGAVLAWSATRRDRWWARTQWAVDHVLGDVADAQLVGLAVLEVQVRHARSTEEAGVIGAVSDTLLEPLLAETSADPTGDATDADATVLATRYVVRPARPRTTTQSALPPPDGDAGRPGTPRVVPVTAVERDAARLRTQVDTRLGRATPSPVADVARAGPG
jgi:hypothetical protein